MRSFKIAMRRAFCLLLIAVCLIGMMALPIAAADEYTYHDVLYGTPKIDGEIDAAYSYSYHETAAAELINIQPWGAGGENTVFRVDTYMLWDENCLYLAAKVYDDTLNYVPYDQAFSEHEGYAELADMFICCFLTEENQYYKVGVDAFGMYISAQDAAYNYIDVASAQYAAARNAEQAYYIVEMALPFHGGLTEGFTEGWHFMVANAATSNESGCYTCGPLGGCYSNSLRLIADRAADLVPPPPAPKKFSLSDIPDVAYAAAAGILACVACVTVAWISVKRHKNKTA